MPGDNIDELEKKLQSARKEFDEDYNPKTDADESIGDGARAGVELVGATLGGALLGFLLDKAFGTSPILFLVFIILGVITGFYNVYKITNNIGTSVGFGGLNNAKKQAKQSQQERDDDA